jgi:hypothetical protein
MKILLAVTKSILISLISLQAFADIQIIKSKINGQAYEVGDSVNILNPSFYLGGDLVEQTKKLYPNGDVAKEACRLLGFYYTTFKTESGLNVERVNLELDGAMSFLESDEFISVLTCRKSF